MEESSLPKNAADLVRSGKAPKKLRMFLATGLGPHEPVLLLRCLARLAADRDEEVRTRARKTLAGMPLAIVVETCSSENMPGDALALLARFFPHEEKVMETMLLNHSVQGRTVSYIASLPYRNLLEIIGRNREWLERFPRVIERLSENPDTPAEILHLWRERIERLRGKTEEKEKLRQKKEPAPKPSGEAFSTLLTEEKEGRKDTPESGGSGARTASITELLRDMTAGQKVALAMKGNSEVRKILIVDKNRAVSTKVLENPMITDSEIEFYSRITNLEKDVLRKIGANREWTKKPAIVGALVNNPKTPLAISMKLAGRLGVRNLKMLSRNRNVPEALRHTAENRYWAKKEGK